MLSKNSFNACLNEVNSLLAFEYKIKDQSVVQIIFDQLEDLDDASFVIGVNKLIKNEVFYQFPSISKIRKYVEAEMYKGLSINDLELLAEVRRITNKPLSNTFIDNYLSGEN